MELVAVNDTSPIESLVYLLRHDSEHGPTGLEHTIKAVDHHFYIENKNITVFQESDASVLPWGSLGIDLVIDCTGAYASTTKASSHLRAGAKRVLISAAPEDEMPTIVYGINDAILTKDDLIISGASCSTVGLAPLARALNDIAPIQQGVATTIHAFTPSQMVLDNPQSKGNLRRSRTASTNIIPTVAAFADAIGRVLPTLQGKLTGSAIRVPVTRGSYVTLVALVKAKNLTIKSLNAAMFKHGDSLFGYADDELVSGDIAGTAYECIFDPYQTKVLDAGEDLYFIECAAWFDNETSYVSHLVKLADIL